MENFTEKVIEAVKSHAILYDYSHPDFKNIRKKNKVWDEIGKILEIDGKYMLLFFITFALPGGP